MSSVSDIMLGLSHSVDAYTKNQQDRSNEVFKNQLDEQSKIKEQAANQQAEGARIQADAKAKLDAEGKMSPEMADSLMPGLSASVKAFQQTNGRLPTISEAKSGMEGVLSKMNQDHNKDQAATERHMKEQTQMEEFSIKNIENMRADPAVNRTELQRDAAGMAYNTIRKAESEGNPLAALQNRDVLMQLVQARKGSAPTKEDMDAVDQKLAKGGVNNLITFATGNPNLVGATTDATLKNLKEFVIESGLKSDKNHVGYMSTHLVKPKDLEQDRWDNIIANHRGVAFADQMKASDADYPSKNSIEDKKAALRAKLGL